MSEYPFEELLLFDDGTDELVMEDGLPVANQLGCPDGHRVLVTVGYEGSPHAMPLGLRHQPSTHSGIDNDETPEQAAQIVSALAEAGAVTAMAHSEEDDISDQLIVASGLDAMEWYNIHGNFQVLMGGDVISGSASDVLDALGSMRSFFPDSGSGANADLVYLKLLQSFPVEGLNKWQRVLQARPITGLLGSDVHRNVSVSPVCDREDPVEQLACVSAAQAILPTSLQWAISGGALILSDGDRIDSYERVLRWLHNRVIVPDKSLSALKQALRAGRSFGVFSVFGEPDLISFSAKTHSGELVQMGDSASGPLHLRVELPSRLTPTPGSTTFTSADIADVDLHVVVRRSSPNGIDVVFDENAQSGVIELDVEQPGSYYVELWLTPNHLRDGLGTMSELADGEYLWILSNPIHLVSSGVGN